MCVHVNRGVVAAGLRGSRSRVGGSARTNRGQQAIERTVEEQRGGAGHRTGRRAAFHCPARAVRLAQTSPCGDCAARVLRALGERCLTRRPICLSPPAGRNAALPASRLAGRGSRQPATAVCGAGPARPFGPRPPHPDAPTLARIRDAAARARPRRPGKRLQVGGFGALSQASRRRAARAFQDRRCECGNGDPGYARDETVPWPAIVVPFARLRLADVSSKKCLLGNRRRLPCWPR